MLVYLNGRFVPEGEAQVSIWDQGLLIGLGAFETLRAYGGRLFRLREHLTRLDEALGALGIRASVSALGDAAEALLGRQSLSEARVRITVTAGSAGEGVGGGSLGRPTALVTAGPVGAPPGEAYRSGIAAVRHDLPHGLGMGAGRKVTSYLGWVLARRAASAAGAGEALLVDARDRVVEGAHSNLFVVQGGEVLTPPLSSGALPGVTRAVVLELLSAEGIPGGEREVRWEDLERAQEIFVTSSIAEVLPVTRVAGVGVGNGAPGALTLRIAAAYRARVAHETGSTGDPAGSGSSEGIMLV